MQSLGITEVIVMFVMLSLYAIPIAVAVWVVITLNRIHSGQKDIQNRLEEIAHVLRQGQGGNQTV